MCGCVSSAVRCCSRFTGAMLCCSVSQSSICADRSISSFINLNYRIFTLFVLLLSPVSLPVLRKPALAVSSLRPQALARDGWQNGQARESTQGFGVSAHVVAAQGARLCKEQGSRKRQRRKRLGRRHGKPSTAWAMLHIVVCAATAARYRAIKTAPGRRRI